MVSTISRKKKLIRRKKRERKTTCQKKKKYWTKTGTIKLYLILVYHDIKLKTVDLRSFTTVVQLIASTIHII